MAATDIVLLSNLTAIADRQIRRRFITNFFARVPILSVMAAKAETSSSTIFGRPGTSMLIGGNKHLVQARQQTTDGGREVHILRQNATAPTAGKHMAERDTTPQLTGTQSQVDCVGSAVFRWSLFMDQIRVWKNTLRLSSGQEYKLLPALELATSLTTEQTFQTIAKEIWLGNPGNQNATIWSRPIGINQVCQTGNTYGGIDRTSDTSWVGKRITAAKTPTLALIDDANVTQGIADVGEGVDYGLCSKSVYLALKAEAITKGGTLLLPGMPQAAKYGITKEAVQYGNVIIIYDPMLKDWTAGGSSSSSSGGDDVLDLSKALFLMTSEDWFFETHPQASWKVDTFEDQGRIEGGNDAMTALFSLMYRFWCERPDRSILYTNVS